MHDAPSFEIGDDALDHSPDLVDLLVEFFLPVEKIAELVGHKGGSTVTEKVYRKQIRPVPLHGADAMDLIFPANDNDA